MRVLNCAFLVGCATVFSGCEHSTGLNVDAHQTEIEGTLTAFVTAWLDLDEYFGADIRLSGTGPGLALRLGEHHEIRCTQVLQYAYVSVTFSADPQQWYRYRVDCREGTPAPAPRVSTPLNLTQYFANADGRVLETAVIDPPRLAMPITADGKNPPVVSLGHLIPGFSLESGETNIWLLCKEAGEGTLYLHFAAGSSPDNGEYRLVCRVDHDQGGGG
ncbi:MAG TPA: hypothetical protein VF006_30015 [Longimicrobium sp.]